MMNSVTHINYWAPINFSYIYFFFRNKIIIVCAHIIIIINKMIIFVNIPESKQEN